MVGIGMMVLNLFWSSVTMCMCGHMSTMTAAVLMPSFAGLVFFAVRGRNNKAWERILNYLLLAVLALMVAKNTADILWNGHSPLLR